MKTMPGITSANIRLSDEEWELMNNLARFLKADSKNAFYKKCLSLGARQIMEGYVNNTIYALSSDDDFGRVNFLLDVETKTQTVQNVLTTEELKALQSLLLKVKDLL